MPPKAGSSSPAKAPKADKPKPKSKEQPLLIKGYLIFFNLLSFFGWVSILSTLIKHMAMGAQTPSYPIAFAARLLERFRPLRLLMLDTYANVPEPFGELLRRASTLHANLGPLVAAVQSLAILEVVHVVIGWVRSPVPTTALQVASRLFMVWVISEQFSEASANPFYATMVLAWSLTESVRYPFYSNALMGSDSDGLLWARYTLFYVLYPLGAGSEAMLIFSTLPPLSTLTSIGAWSIRELFFLSLFIIWWPGLYVMYTHMMKQRRRAIGKGLMGDKLVNKKKEERKALLEEAKKKAK